MKISGFSFARNAVKFYFPIEQSIRSILPVCDEFIIAIGKGDEDDATREVVENIGDPRIRIIDTEWTDMDTLRGKIYAQQTDIALKECTGDWCFYVQADEVVHEDDLPVIKARCEDLFYDRMVEGLVFDYLHFWGDYEHHHTGHGWYRKEIRIVRNRLGVKSRNDAQSFHFPDRRKLRVARANARMFHYGWVRPPHLMQNKSRSMNADYLGEDAVSAMFKGAPPDFDYGPLSRLAVYEGMHPAVMKELIAGMDWKDKLRDTDPPGMVREPHKDEQLKYRVISAIERWTGRDFNHKNWRRIPNV